LSQRGKNAHVVPERPVSCKLIYLSIIKLGLLTISGNEFFFKLDQRQTGSFLKKKIMMM
jgi:hypothetical protein